MQHLRKRKLPTLSMAPMIDCVFLLLIFLMVSTTFAPIPGYGFNSRRRYALRRRFRKRLSSGLPILRPAKPKALSL